MLRVCVVCLRFVKALDRGAARLCCLAKDGDEAEYTRLVQALCEENGVDLIMVDSGKELGEWCGLVKYDADGSARKAVRTSCAVVTDFGEETAALTAEIGSASCRERVCQYV